MKLQMRDEGKKEPCTFTLSAIMEMEIWDFCHTINAMQLLP